MLAVVLHDGARRGRGMAFLGAVGFVWLLFLPNAPYIVTDFVHVGRVSGVPVWYDAAMIASFAAVGLVLGLVSILLVQGVVERRFGAAVGWLMLAPVFFLCSAGIYIGRVHRLNSWDAITSPGTLLRGFADRLADPLAQPEAIVALVGAMGLLTVAYLVLYTISDLRLDRVRLRPRLGRLDYGSWRNRTVVPPASVWIVASDTRERIRLRPRPRSSGGGSSGILHAPSSETSIVRPAGFGVGPHADSIHGAGMLDRVGDGFVGCEDHGFT